jgi:hypothetical protein
MAKRRATPDHERGRLRRARDDNDSAVYVTFLTLGGQAKGREVTFGPFDWAQVMTQAVRDRLCLTVTVMGGVAETYDELDLGFHDVEKGWRINPAIRKVSRRFQSIVIQSKIKK